jgi:hypothetical protein
MIISLALSLSSSLQAMSSRSISIISSHDVSLLDYNDDRREGEKEVNSPTLHDHITLFDADVIIFLNF